MGCPDRDTKGKNIILSSINTDMHVAMDLGGTIRHFYVEEGASLSAKNVAFKNGKGSHGGAIDSIDTIARLDNAVFEGNACDARGLLLFHCTDTAVSSET